MSMVPWRGLAFRAGAFQTLQRQQIPTVLTSLVASNCSITLIRIVNGGSALANVLIEDGNGAPYLKIALPAGGIVADETPEGIYMPLGVQWSSDQANVFATANIVLLD